MSHRRAKKKGSMGISRKVCKKVSPSSAEKRSCLCVCMYVSVCKIFHFSTWNLHFPRPFFHHSWNFSRKLCHRSLRRELFVCCCFYHRIFPKQNFEIMKKSRWNFFLFSVHKFGENFSRFVGKAWRRIGEKPHKLQSDFPSSSLFTVNSREIILHFCLSFFSVLWENSKK
jgi:hypothetical protein